MYSVKDGEGYLTKQSIEAMRSELDVYKRQDIPGASDSARYKALGNSVAIPCVDFVLRGIAYFLRKMKAVSYTHLDVYKRQKG